ncbi:hypothetical protein [Shewanella surugensis]|uniref:Uncharacterized protein n=1 Tax=Shewanella surugensis TaxID=212020 RepID=A0ABT0L705_9GAMM|nr:hypothetical protein [Shewanella surugensis]MCL1123472.1 hypothetical protein [Shewanella surugensis]
MTSPLESNGGIDERTSWGFSGAKITAQNYYGMTVGVKHLQSLGENFFLFMGSEWNATVGLKCSFTTLTIKTAFKVAKQDISMSKFKYKISDKKIVASEDKVYAAKLDKVLSDFSLKLNEHTQIASEATTVINQLKDVGSKSTLIAKDSRIHALKVKDRTSDIKQLANDFTDEANSIESCNTTLSSFINDIGVYNTLLTSRVSLTEIAPIKFLN